VQQTWGHRTEPLRMLKGDEKRCAAGRKHLQEQAQGSRCFRHARGIGANGGVLGKPRSLGWSVQACCVVQPRGSSPSSHTGNSGAGRRVPPQKSVAGGRRGANGGHVEEEAGSFRRFGPAAGQGRRRSGVRGTRFSRSCWLPGVAKGGGPVQGRSAPPPPGAVIRGKASRWSLSSAPVHCP